MNKSMNRNKIYTLTVLALTTLAVVPAIWGSGKAAPAQKDRRSLTAGPAASLSQILGRPTDRSITLSLLSANDLEAYIEYGTTSGKYTQKSAPVSLKAGVPTEIEMTGLKTDTKYYYRVKSRQAGASAYTDGTECFFHTQRKPGSTFVFALQGDSHPERQGTMYAPELYAETMRSAVKDNPDFYITLGDDFSLERLIEQNTVSQANADRIYAHQRSFLGIVGSTASLFLVNGNHEQAARHWLDDTPNNPGVVAGVARNRFYPLPAPDTFYTGDTEKVKFIGYLRDYYAWTWGDALFVAIDPYWHSTIGVDDGKVGTMAQQAAGNGNNQPAPVNNGNNGNNGNGGGGNGGGRRRRQQQGNDPNNPPNNPPNSPAYAATEEEEFQTAGGGQDNGNPNGQQGGGRRGQNGGGGQGGGGNGGGGRKKGQNGGGGRNGGGKGQRDMWQITLGDDQYKWLAKTLKESKAKYKFVFAHHVMGTGRGGIEQAGLYEWGGKDRRGVDLFKEKRPNWEMPIHQLFVKTGVTIFFQGHDHAYAKQELDGVIYQETPNPADDTYTAFNKEAYQTGTVLPNTGHIRVRVAPEGVKVEYVRSFLKKDETATLKNGMIADSYTITPKKASSVANR